VDISLTYQRASAWAWGRVVALLIATFSLPILLRWLSSFSATGATIGITLIVITLIALAARIWSSDVVVLREDQRWATESILGLSLGLAYVLLQIVLSVKFPDSGLFPSAGGAEPRAPGAGGFLILAAATGSLAIFEETVFRGVLLRFLLREWGTTAAIILSSGLFALAHIPSSGLGPHLVLFLAAGLAFAVVAIWRGSLAGVMTAHLFNNILGSI